VAAACIALALLTVVALPAAPASAEAPAAIGWWSQASSLPPPPDVSSDGLYVQGGPSGPVAISALRFTVPTGESPTKLVLVPTGVASPSAAVQVCPLKPASAQFAPAQNGAWADAPAYDCEGKNAVVGTTDDAGTLTFDVSTLAQSGTLAVAVIATGPGDRVPIAKPDASALSTAPSSTDSAATSDDGSTYVPSDATADATDVGTTPATGSSSVALPPVAPPSAAAPDATTPSPSAAAAAGAGTPGPDHPLAIAGTSPHDLATRLGGLAAIGILIAALIAYSLGFGLLGGRFVDS
jgi:S-DNA-T family DNA segregation ATPase FtsK/SpoIIIE